MFPGLKSDMRTAYITHPSSLLHDMGPGHPECPDRVRAIETALADHKLMSRLEHYEAPAASVAQLERVHGRFYIDEIFEQSPSRGMIYLDPDTAMNPHTLEAALHAAGAGILAVDLVMSGNADNAFCNIRPPGHHAGRSRASGFCIFNNIAVAAANAIQQHGLARIAIADFDVHHGNGTDEIFNNDGGGLKITFWRRQQRYSCLFSLPDTSLYQHSSAIPCHRLHDQDKTQCPGWQRYSTANPQPQMAC